jgi:acetylornithine deacetylase/succinyl-diaminopimelate desuccinylase-like protein
MAAGDATLRAGPSAAERLGDGPALELLQELVAIAPTNLEDLAAHRLEKPAYPRAAEAIARWARRFGLATRIYDPLVERGEPELAGIPRPNVVVDLDRGAEETVLVLAHYDVVPVPVEQRARWKSPPHTLTLRPDGRLYGRGSNDDLGSGVTATLLAMRRLAENDRLRRNVRLLVCCDEETGGIGGIEALRSHDDRLPTASPERLVRGDVALIPDGSPHTTVGSSGVAFLEGAMAPPARLSDALRYARTLVELHELARSWKSAYRSPDWPDRGAPEPVITGRASVTRFDLALDPAAEGLSLLAAHAESDAANQVARAVTLAFRGADPAPGAARERLGAGLPAPFRLAEGGSTAMSAPEGARVLQLLGVAAHGGYPHRGHNPVPAAIDLLGRALEAGLLADTPVRSATFTVDLRLTPEMELEPGTAQALADVRRRWGSGGPKVELVAPPARCRPGYALEPNEPAAVRLERTVRAEFGEAGFFGEYGGTDASSLRGLLTPRGAPLPAIVFGSMDPAANIHDVDESVDPRLLAGVARTIERFVLEP